MPVDIIHYQLNYSGSSRAAVELANCLAECGYGVRLVVVGRETKDTFPIKNAETIYLDVQKKPGLLNKITYPLGSAIAICKYLTRHKPRLVIASSKEMALLTLIARILTGIKLRLIAISPTHISSHLQQSKSALVAALQKYIYRLLLPRADNIIAICNKMVDDLVANYKIPASKIKVIYPLLDRKFFGYTPVEPKEKEIIFIGRMDKYKAPITALKIFILLQNRMPGVKLRMIGDGPLMPEVRKFVEQNSLRNSVIIEGIKQEILPYLQNASVLMMVSVFEGFGQVLAEAIAVGIPAVAFDCPVGPSEIIIDGVNGYLIPPGEIELFVKKLEQSLAQEWNHKKIAETANKFHPDVVIKGYIDVINDVIATSRLKGA